MLLRILLYSDYKVLLNETRNSMEIKRVRTLALEIFKTLNNLNPDFTKDVFSFSPYRRMIFSCIVEIHQIMVIEA